MIMKNMIMVAGLLSFIVGDSFSQKTNEFTRSEKRFIKNVVKIQGEKPLVITKRNDDYIVVEFDTTMVVLKPDGYVGEMWIRTDGDWLSLGTEQDAY
jgi:hypothetical protein